MPLTNLQTLVLKDLIVDAVKSRSSDMTLTDDFRALSDDLMREFPAPTRSLIKAAMLVCDKAEALFDKTALTREAQAQDTAKAQKSAQNAAQARSNLEKSILAGYAQVAVAENQQRRGHAPTLDIALTKKRVEEAEGEFAKAYGESALDDLKKSLS